MRQLESTLKISEPNISQPYQTQTATDAVIFATTIFKVRHDVWLRLIGRTAAG